MCISTRAFARPALSRGSLYAMAHVCTELRMHVRAYIRRNDWPVVIPPVVHPEVHAAITLLVLRRGIHVRRGRCVKRHNGQISENPNAPMAAEPPAASSRLETFIWFEIASRTNLKHSLNVSLGIWMKRFEWECSVRS